LYRTKIFYLRKFGGYEGKTSMSALNSPALPLAARAQPSWADRPVRIIVPVAPGGSLDILGRVFARQATGSLGQAVVAYSTIRSHGINTSGFRAVDSMVSTSLSDLTAPPRPVLESWEVAALPLVLDPSCMSNFRPVDRDTGFLMPPSVDEWLPQRHLARFVVEVIGSLDLRAMIGSYRGSGEWCCCTATK